MNSHTVPKKLLEQFAYDDPRTKSKRLWQYQKGLPPWWKASPDRATRWEAHFRDPANTQKEQHLELRLKQEFEDPVNSFIETIGSASFSWSADHVRLLTGYIRMLFTRSRARRQASVINAKKKLEAIRSVLTDESRIDDLEVRNIAFLFENGVPIPGPGWSAKQDIKRMLRNQIEEHSRPDADQRDYIQALETMMEFPDETMLYGDWGVFSANPEYPFVLGDAPVVTWERTPHNTLYFGIGFARPNVEVFLPISPMACIQVLPRVERTRKIRMPSSIEVNQAQAAFSTKSCYTNLNSAKLDALLQPKFGTMRMGIDGFNINHRDAGELLFRILMNDGNPVPF